MVESRATSTPECFQAMAQSVGYRVVHVAQVVEVDQAAVRANMAYTFDRDTGTWRAYTPQDSHGDMAVWRVHLAPDETLPVVRRVVSEAPRVRPSLLQRVVGRMPFRSLLASLTVAMTVMVGGGVSHAQIGAIDPGKARAYGEYLSLVVKLNQLHIEYCRPPVAPALAQTVRVCEALALAIEPKTEKKGQE